MALDERPSGDDDTIDGIEGRHLEEGVLNAPEPTLLGKRVTWESLAILALVLVLGLAAYFRFTGLSWDDAYHLHPDERFLTDVASLLKTTDPLTYLRTSESPLNPYNVGKTFYVYGNFPMTATRIAAEFLDRICQTLGDQCSLNPVFYDGIHLVGRFLSATMDLVSIVFIFLIGRRLYDWKAGLIGAALLAGAVLPIQQSHFFTMDNWAAALTTMTMYAAVRASEDGSKKRWWLMFGIGLGLAVASRINLAPLALMAGVSAFVWLARRATGQDASVGWRYALSPQGSRDLQWAVLGLILAGLASVLVFRVAQPYAFADRQTFEQSFFAENGEFPGTIETIIGSLIGFNSQWRDNMTEIQNLQSPDASFPPALQWTDRTPVLFPLTNMILWGMGLTAGIAAVIGFLWALWRITRARPDWTSHVLIVSWTGLYFLFMATRWVKSIRYFLPIYPFLLLLAGWALVELWKRARESTWKRLAVAFLMILVIAPTYLWANAFTEIYRQPVTRVRASEWIFDNIPSGATVVYEVNGEERERQIPLRHYEFLPENPPLILNFALPESGSLTAIRFNYLSGGSLESPQETADELRVVLVEGQSGNTLADLNQPLKLNEPRQRTEFKVDGIPVEADIDYALIANTVSGTPLSAGTSVLANEHWDDSLPVRYQGQDPYFSFYDGLSEGLMGITFHDSEDKRQSFYRWLDESDYIILSSQRALWSVPRLPLTYPMTTRYYEALFSDELGFDLVQEFHADFHIGPLYVSDVGGKFAWGSPPEIGWPPPGILAAEEAFSVYDHPPVWIFAKSADYSPDRAREILDSIDLDQVIVMTPGQATKAANGLMLDSHDQSIQQANGTFSEIFHVEGIVSRSPWLAAIIWWAAVIVLGWLAFPLTFVVFRGLPDRGYPLARILSLLIISYLAWLAASFRLLSFTRGALSLGLLVLVVANLFLYLRSKSQINAFVRRNARLIVFVEVFAVSLYLLFILIRLGNPDAWDVIWGGEKPMDLSYFNAVLKSSVFPPYDPWFAGGYINYYYYGFVYVGALTKLLGILPTISYNLILPMLFSFTGLGAFSIAYSLVARRDLRSKPSQRSSSHPNPRRLLVGARRKALVAGVTAALLCVLLGNLAEVALVLSTWQKASDSTVSTGISAVDTVIRTVDGGLDLAFTDKVAPIYPGDWFWSATRVINAQPGEVQPITEFPFFTFLYGDLHAHMIALPLTLLALAWAVSLAMQTGYLEQNNRTGSGWAESGLRWMVGGLAIGVLRATNTWDFPTYLFLGALAVAYYAYRQSGKLDLRTIGHALLLIAALAGLSVLLFLPFADSYQVPYSSFSLWPGSYTLLGNYLLIYGLFLFFVVTHLLRELRSWAGTWTQAGLASWEPYSLPLMVGLVIYVVLLVLLVIGGYWIAPLALTLTIASGVLGLRPNLAIERRIALILIASALGLTLLVEFIVLDGDIGRMNTVFKFYMQAWVMLSVASGVVAVWAWPARSTPRSVRRVWQGALALLLAAAALYPVLATKAKWDIRMTEDAPITLDSMAFMEVTSYNDTAYDGSSQSIDLNHDYRAIQWMQRNIDGSPVIAEAHSDNPYRSVGNRVSMYTGLPAIVGWDWHQRQQRALLPSGLISNRIGDVNTLFNTTDTNEALSILEKYGVKYVYAGQLESAYYAPEGIHKFDLMADQGLLIEVYRNAGVSIYEVLN